MSIMSIRYKQFCLNPYYIQEFMDSSDANGRPTGNLFQKANQEKISLLYPVQLASLVNFSYCSVFIQII